MNRSTLTGTLALVLVAGCPATASPPSITGEWTSGSRLRARVERASDGTARFVGWHDGVLDVDCAFARDASGAIRCLPTTPLDGVYFDAACARRAQRFAACAGTAPHFATVSVGTTASDPCDATPLTTELEVHALDDSNVVTATYFYGPAGSCVAAMQPAARLVADLGPIDPSIFAAGTLAREPLAGRLEAEVVTTADGARQRVAVYDTVLARRCTPASAGFLSAAACLPWPSIGYADVIPWRADASCTHAIGHAASLACPAVAILRTTRNADGCGGRAELLGVGATVAQPVYEGRDASACRVVAERPSELFVELGGPLGESVLARTTDERVGHGDPQAVLVSHEGTPLAQLGWESAAHGACSPMTFVDGRTRCVPLAVSVESPPYFADASCTEPLFGGASCVDATVGVHTDTVEGCGEVPSGLVALEPADVTTVFSRDATGACVVDGSSPGPLLRPGALLALDAFPLLEIVVE